MKSGYTGKFLFVNRTKGTCEERPLREDLARDLKGGYGVRVRLIYDTMMPRR
jgi:aldehyde:ferredoxin oxidoreductase